MSGTERQGEGGAARRAPLTMFSPLSAIVRGDPVTVPLEASVRETLEVMERRHVGSVVVADRSGRVPLGIFTLRDLVRRVTLAGGELGDPVATVMTSGLIALGPQASAHQAALTMARNGVRQVVVVDVEGRLVGVVTQEDLFGLQQLGVREISDLVQAARDREGLAAAAEAIRGLAGRLIAQGVGAETLTQHVSTLNDLLTIRVIELAQDRHELPPVPVCWIALGSEGRLEQTFSTDQDNGLVFEADDGDAEAVRQALLPFARDVNDTLEACGFPRCRGGVMAGNPRWCLRVEEWRRAFLGWMSTPDPEAVLHATIFFDLRPIHGSELLAERLSSWLAAEAPRHPLFLRLLAEHAVHTAPPLGLLRDFAFDGSKAYPHTLDLKARGSKPFVDAARTLALAHGLAPTSTAERLRAAAGPAGLGTEAVAAMVDAFHFIHLLRLRGPRGADPERANRVDPDALNELERSVLREAFRQAKRLQAALAARFQLRA